jgi:hypothetical protein
MRWYRSALIMFMDAKQIAQNTDGHYAPHDTFAAVLSHAGASTLFIDYVNYSDLFCILIGF